MMVTHRIKNTDCSKLEEIIGSNSKVSMTKKGFFILTDITGYAEYLTLRQKISIGLEVVQTRKITSASKGSKLTFHIAKLQENANDENKQVLIDIYNDAREKFLTYLEADIANGVITVAENSSNS
jgi:hypothetical protein